MKSTLTKIGATLAIALMSSLAHAAEYQVNISGTFMKPSIYPVMFGIADEATPMEMSLVVDTSLGTPLVIPAGTVVNPSYPANQHITFTTDITIVPKAAIKNLGATLGVSSWTTQNIVPGQITDKSYGLLLQGQLVNGNVSRASIIVDNGVGQMSTSEWECNASNVCQLPQTGYAFSYSLSDFGIMANNEATVTELNIVTPDQKLTNLNQIIVNLSSDQAVKTVMGSHVKVAQKALAKSKNDQVIQAMETVITLADVMVGKKLTAAESELLKAKAQEIINSL